LLGRITVPRGVIVTAVIGRSVDQTSDVSFLPDPTTYTCAAASIILSVKIFSFFEFLNLPLTFRFHSPAVVDPPNGRLLQLLPPNRPIPQVADSERQPSGK
jgi:hypothetical protein